jgi:hypothetical protein
MDPEALLSDKIASGIGVVIVTVKTYFVPGSSG